MEKEAPMWSADKPITPITLVCALLNLVTKVILTSMGGARHRQKGNRIERELVRLHKDIGVRCERYPLSGASRFRGSGHDLDVYARGRDEAPFVAEVKARKNG